MISKLIRAIVLKIKRAAERGRGENKKQGGKEGRETGEEEGEGGERTNPKHQKVSSSPRFAAGRQLFLNKTRNQYNLVFFFSIMY